MSTTVIALKSKKSTITIRKRSQQFVKKKAAEKNLRLLKVTNVRNVIFIHVLLIGMKMNMTVVSQRKRNQRRLKRRRRMEQVVCQQSQRRRRWQLQDQ